MVCNTLVQGGTALADFTAVKASNQSRSRYFHRFQIFYKMYMKMFRYGFSYCRSDYISKETDRPTVDVC